MKNKKIVDYIILNGDAPVENLLERIKNKIHEINNKKKSCIDAINNDTPSLENNKKLLIELKKFEIGKEYKPITRKENDVFISEYKHKINHPLFIGLFYEETFILGKPKGQSQRIAFNELIKSIKKIEDLISKLEDRLNSNISKVNLLEEELKKYENNLDPTSNSNVKNIFEIQVLELVKMGYEPLGGVSVSRESTYQAMVKYEE